MKPQNMSSWCLVLLTVCAAVRLCQSAPSGDKARIKRGLFSNPESRLAPGFGKRSQGYLPLKRFYKGASNRMGMMFGKRSQWLSDNMPEDFQNGLAQTVFMPPKLSDELEERQAVNVVLKNLQQNPDLLLELFSRYVKDRGMDEVTDGEEF